MVKHGRPGWAATAATAAALLLAALLGAVGCQAEAPGPGTGSGEADAAPLAPDAAPLQPALDAAVVVPPDGAPAQADASVVWQLVGDLPVLACGDSADSVYVTPGGLPAMSPARRGDVVRCAAAGTLDEATVRRELDGAGAGASAVAMAGAVTVWNVTYRTLRGDGSAGVTSARVYLPRVPRLARPGAGVPLVVVGHPTTGIADVCAPSRDAGALRDLALPWAALGYPTIAPDHAGLGTEGVHAYLDGRDAGQVMLDGARALRRLLGPGLGDDVLVVGYSQGGGSALSAQALEQSYGTEGKLRGVIGFAPEWPTRLNAFGYVDLLRNPGGPTIFTGVSKVAITVLRQYAWFGMTRGEAAAGDGFPAGERASIVQAIEGQCLIPLGGILQANQPRIGELTDEALRSSLLACIDGGASAPGCVEPGASFHAFLQGNILHGDPGGAPILYIQGLADQILPAAEEAACNVAALRADGVSPEVCSDGAATHATVLGRNLGHALAWGQAVLAGTSRPACASATLPACR